MNALKLFAKITLTFVASVLFLSAVNSWAFGLGVTQAQMEKRALCEKLVREQAIAGYPMDDYFCRAL
jgi:hypothetical protein